MSTLDPALMRFLRFLNTHPAVRKQLPAPRGKTVVYSGSIETKDQALGAWRHLAALRKEDPQRHDYLTLEERLRQFHVTEFGESLFDHANRVSTHLNLMFRAKEALVVWRALSGIYVQGASGRVRALIWPTDRTPGSVFALTEVQVLTRPDVLAEIDLDPAALLDFKLQVRAGGVVKPITVL